MENIKTNPASEQRENILGTEKIGRLLRMYAIPSIVSILVNALYNIVDQIFIGWGVGYEGNGATNIVFPIAIVFASFALMFGDGSSAYLSLKLGAGESREAAKGVANGVILSVVSAVIFTSIAFAFMPQLLNLFGCTPSLEAFAKDYGYIVAAGLPFMLVGTTVNSIVRADGRPKYAMMTMLIGAVLNVVLDPIFIFVFGLGVKGAAIATAISQVVSFVLNIIYIRKLKTITLKGNFRFNVKLSLKIVQFGVSSFITQISTAIVIGLQNNLLGDYGASSEFGSDIPITVIGIIMKVSEILNSIVLGLAMGSQPIIGYNFGARNYDRVKKTLKYVIINTIIISAAALLLFQLIPDKLIILFGKTNDVKYMEFAVLAFRVYLLMIVVESVQTPVGIFLQATGKSAKAALVSLSKQALFFVPAMLILGKIFGLMGVLSAKPVSSVLSFLIAIIMLVMGFKRTFRNTAQS